MKARFLTAALLAAGALAGPLTAWAQEPFGARFGSSFGSPFDPALRAGGGHSKHDKAKPAERDAPQPDAVIPVTPLGFAPPAAYYLGDRVSQASLNFLDEDELLFTFRVPGLIRRDPPASSPQSPAVDPENTPRNIRAVVLSLPSGRVTAESLWRLHDFGPYLWTFKNGAFLLRDRNSVQLGDAGLRLTPYLRFPGPVLSLDLDPNGALLLADTSEPPAPDARPEPGSQAQSSANADIAYVGAGPGPGAPINGRYTPGSEHTAPAAQNILRILRLENRSVLLLTRVPEPVRVPLDGDGYYEALRGNGSNWTLMYDRFAGQSTPLAQIESDCYPALDVEAPGLLLASACTSAGGRKLFALVRSWEERRRIAWEASIPATSVWPVLAHAASGSRMARATLDVTHPVGPMTPLDASDIRGQTVQVYDLADGKVALTLPLSPILDAGGNFALSPSGNRFAVLNGGAIQVYNLPPAPLLPASAPPLPAPVKK